MHNINPTIIIGIVIELERFIVNICPTAPTLIKLLPKSKPAYVTLPDNKIKFNIALTHSLLPL